MAPRVPHSIPLHGQEKGIYLPHQLSPDQFSSLVHCIEGYLPLILALVLKICFWPLCHWMYDAPLGKMG